jgi:hypothetical protein
VQIVEYDHERLCAGRALQEAGDPVEQAEAGRLQIVDRRRGAQIGDLLAHLGDDIRDLRRACTELPAESLRVGCADVGADRLHPRPVRGCPAGFPTAAPDHLRPAFGCCARQLFSKTTLADARLSADDEKPPASCQRIDECPQQRLELAFAPDEDAADPAAGRLLTGVGRLRRGARHPAQVERRVLPQNRLLEVAEPAARLEPELLDQQPARVLIGLQGLGLAVAAVEREHQLRAQALS